MKTSTHAFMIAAVFAVTSTASAATDRIVGSSDRTSANEALDRAEQNAPEDADHGLSTAREAVNNNGIGHDPDAANDHRGERGGPVGAGSRSNGRSGGSDGRSGSGRNGRGGGPGR